MRFLFTTIACLIALTASAQTPTAEAIVTKMVGNYAAATSYQDAGVVLTHRPGEDVSDDKPFKTYFVRPDRFRFEWIRHHPYPPMHHITYDHVIWSNQSGSFTYWSEPALFERAQSLSLAVAGATGVSSGAAHTISRLLLNSVTGFSLSDLRELTLLGQEQFEGTDCFRVRGKHPRGNDYEMWIGANDYLLRKLQKEIVPGTIQEEIHRDIQINQDVPGALFDFEPPK